MRTPYSLTLEYGDRMAIDWIGYRYSHGDDLRAILMKCEQDGETEWSDDAPITFRFPEHLAWTASEAIDGDNLACFAESLVSKLRDFQDKII